MNNAIEGIAEATASIEALFDSHEKKQALDALTFDIDSLDDYGYGRLTIKSDGGIVFKDKINLHSDSDFNRAVKGIISSQKTKLIDADKIEVSKLLNKALTIAVEGDSSAFDFEGREFREYAASIEEPELQKPYVIDGIIRRGEVLMSVDAPKTMKTWRIIHTILAVATGRPFLGFTTRPGKVLHIDNELERGTLDFRIAKVSSALAITPDDLKGMVNSWSIRGKGIDINLLAEQLPKNVKRGEYSMIVLDALYRMYPPRFNENDNHDVTQLYNTLAKLANDLDCAIVVIHHASKGSQASKSVTDIGAGGGAMTRAADTIIVHREHEVADCVVMEGRTRSFKDFEPTTLKFDFPLFEVKEGIEAAVKQVQTNHTKKQLKADKDDMARISDRYSDGTPFNTTDVHKFVGCSYGRAAKLINKMVEDNEVCHHSSFIRKGAREATDHYSTKTMDGYQSQYTRDCYYKEPTTTASTTETTTDK